MAFPLLPVTLLALPLVEIAVLVMVGSRIGVLATIGLVLATGVLGAVLLRVQGFGAMARIRAALEDGRAPDRELVHGLMIMAAGFLLLLPGFVTDAAGLLLFLPPVRDLAWRALKGRIVTMTAAGTNARHAGRRRGDGRTIDLDADDFTRDRDARRPPIDDGR